MDSYRRPRVSPFSRSVIPGVECYPGTAVRTYEKRPSNGEDTQMLFSSSKGKHSTKARARRNNTRGQKQVLHRGNQAREGSASNLFQHTNQSVWVSSAILYWIASRVVSVDRILSEHGIVHSSALYSAIRGSL